MSSVNIHNRNGSSESQPNLIRVLHVDDEPDFAEMVASFLEGEDDRLRVETSTSPADIPNTITDLEIDCIVSDYDMPDMDGIEVLEAVREEHPDLPFILFTGKGSEEVASEAIRKGVTDYLQKGGSERYELLANRIINVVSEHQASRELEATRKRYGQILEHASDFIMIGDEAGTVSYISPAVERVLGYDPEELTGTNAFDFVHPDDVDQAIESLDDIIEEPGREDTMEFRAKHQDGSWRWAEVRRRNLLQDPIIEGILVNVRDVTERKKQEQELEQKTRELQRQYRHLFEEAPIMAVRTSNEDGRPIIGDCNQLFVDTLGYSRSDVIGEPLESFYTPASREALLSEGGYDRALAGEFTRERRDLLTADGETVETILRATPRPEGEERDLGTLAMYVDISERADMRRHKERLERFAGVVSHDLRNPLSVAEGRLDLAKEDCDSPHLDDVAKALHRMDELIDNLLTLAREGQAVGDVEPIHPGSLAESCWSSVEASTATLEVNIHRSIRADGERLTQVFENLFRNSIDHGGADVSITVGELEDGFYVEDDGPGIPKENRDAIYEPGYSTTDSGIGFGLSIVAEIVEAHGWELTVTEGAMGGARFEITGVEVVE